MLDEQFLMELKSRNEIGEIAASYIQLRQRGKNLVGLCPFHSEKTPSFTVFPDSQSFYCFGCGAGGDVITFIKKIENLDYIEAVRFLAQRAGMAMPDEGYDDSYARLKAKILQINRQTALFYNQCLVSPGGEKGLEYLRSRGISDRFIRRFGLGYAPEGWDAAIRHLTGMGFTKEDLVMSAVAVKNTKGNIYDQFRGRVIFPIIDIRGNVVAFGGRVIESGKGPKYLNSPDTPVFKKSRNLFALNFAKSAKERTLILAEGYMDVVSLHQAGFSNSVATLGTALTSEQARMISQYADEVVVSYDSDSAGQKATQRAIDIFGEIGLKARVLKVKDAKDPDEFLKKFGSACFRMLLEGAENSLEYEISQIRRKYDLTSSDGKVEYLKEFSLLMSHVNNPIERDVYTSKAAEELGVQKETLSSQIDYLVRKQAKADKRKKDRDLSVFAVDSGQKRDVQRNANLRVALAEERLIGILLKNPDYREFILSKITPEDFVTDENREIFKTVSRCLQDGVQPEMIGLSQYLDDKQMGKVAGILAQSQSFKATKKEAEDYIDVILSIDRKKTPEQLNLMSREQLKEYVEELAAGKK